MGKIQVVKYTKKYLTKARYRCKRYFFYLPNSLAEKIDPSIDYEIRLFGPFVVALPKGNIELLTIPEQPKLSSPEETQTAGFGGPGTTRTHEG